MQCWGFSSKSKTEECDQGNLRVSDNCWIFVPCSAEHFWEGTTRLSLKVATKGYFPVKDSWFFSIFEATFLSINGGVVRVLDKFGTCLPC